MSGKSFTSLVLSIFLSLSLSNGLAAQSVNPGEREAKEHTRQQKLVDELKALQTEITLAQNLDKKKERDRLFELLKEARSEAGGRYVSDAIWQNWIDSAPSEEISDLVKKSMERRRWHDYEGARVILNEAIEKAPDYSEVWNQRAYIFFLQEKFDASLEDIEEALKREPRHFGALAGKARIFFHKGETEMAIDALKAAIEIHPWIQERVLLLQQPESGQEPRENKEGTTEL